MMISLNDFIKNFGEPPMKYVIEKVKGADGKACWKGYRYAGTEDGKDKCVKVNETVLYRNEALRLEIIEHSGPVVVQEAEYQGRKVKLNKPMQGDDDGDSKFKVYVKDGEKKNADGTMKVKKVSFGAKGSENRIKKNNPERRKSFRARHNCDNPGPKTKARYWSCKKW